MDFGEIPILHLVVEDGHPNVGAVRTIFNEFEQRLIRHGAPLLRTVKIVKKSESTQLMAADFIAHTYLLMRKAAFPNAALEGKFDYDDPASESALSSIEFGPDAFAAFKAEYEQDKKEKMEEWRRQGLAD
jgi:hypothetical protein